jgi:hypothetical protein
VNLTGFRPYVGCSEVSGALTPAYWLDTRTPPRSYTVVLPPAGAVRSASSPGRTTPISRRSSGASARPPEHAGAKRGGSLRARSQDARPSVSRRHPHRGEVCRRSVEGGCTEQAGSARISSDPPGGSQNTRKGSRAPFALISSSAPRSIAVRDGPVGRDELSVRPVGAVRGAGVVLGIVHGHYLNLPNGRRPGTVWVPAEGGSSRVIAFLRLVDTMPLPVETPMSAFDGGAR